MKKIVYSLGVSLTAIAPIATVVSCSDEVPKDMEARAAVKRALIEKGEDDTFVNSTVTILPKENDDSLELTFKIKKEHVTKIMTDAGFAPLTGSESLAAKQKQYDDFAEFALDPIETELRQDISVKGTNKNVSVGTHKDTSTDAVDSVIEFTFTQIATTVVGEGGVKIEQPSGTTAGYLSAAAIVATINPNKFIVNIADTTEPIVKTAEELFAEA